MRVSLASTPVSLSIVRNTFGFSFCQRPWDLTKRRDDTVVADMVADMAADMEVHMMADMELDMVADMEVDMVADKVVDMMAKQKLPKQFSHLPK